MTQQTVTITFTVPADPIRTTEQLEHVLGHLDSAAFAVGLQVEGAECELRGRRASD